MIDLKKTIPLWGLFDLCSIGWYFGWRLFHGQIPFYHDITKSVKSTTSFGIPSLSIITFFSLVLYLSLILSGIYLIKHRKAGAILSYIQTPFRLLGLVPPSIFFIIWPLKYIFENPKAISAIITFVVLMLLSEFLKLTSVIMWRKNTLTA
jgi:hypothetical protein